MKSRSSSLQLWLPDSSSIQFGPTRLFPRVCPAIAGSQEQTPFTVLALNRTRRVFSVQRLYGALVLGAGHAKMEYMDKKRCNKNGRVRTNRLTKTVVSQ